MSKPLTVVQTGLLFAFGRSIIGPETSMHTNPRSRDATDVCIGITAVKNQMITMDTRKRERKLKVWLNKLIGNCG